MNRDELKGKMERVKGKVKERAAQFTGDERLEGEGQAEQIKGQAQEGYGAGRRKAGEALRAAGRKFKR